MKANITAIEVSKRDDNKGIISLDIKVDDIDNWINLWSKKGRFEIDIDIGLSQK